MHTNLLKVRISKGILRSNLPEVRISKEDSTHHLPEVRISTGILRSNLPEVRKSQDDYHYTHQSAKSKDIHSDSQLETWPDQVF
jgi:hypothetical protein